MSDVFGTNPESTNNVKVCEDDAQSGKLEEKLVGSAYVNVIKEEGTVGDRLKVEINTGALASAMGSDHKVATSEADEGDEDAGYLSDKMMAGKGMTVSENSSGAVRKMEIALNADINDLNDVVIGTKAEGQIISYNSSTSKFVNTDYAVETAFSGTASKIPNADAIADVLRELTITDATNVGNTGDPIMYKTKSINIYGMPISTVAYTNTNVFTDHFPKSIPDPDYLANQSIAPFGFRNKRYVSIKSIESSPQGAGDGYAYAFANFTLDEDWDAGDGSGIRARLFVASREVAPRAKQATIRIQYTIFDTDNNNVISSVVKNVLWDSGDSIIKEVDFPLSVTGLTAGKPLNVFLAISVASAEYTPETDYTMYHEIGITGLRIINLTKTINLRTDDIDI